MKVKVNIDHALLLFEETYLRHRKPTDTKDDFYCGITDDLERRKGPSEHNIDNYIITVECEDSETAKTFEKRLEEADFNIGDKSGNGNEKTVFAYMYRRIPGVSNP